MNGFNYIVFTVFYCDMESFIKEFGSFLDAGPGKKYEITDGSNYTVRDIYFPEPLAGSQMDKILVWQPLSSRNKTVFSSNLQDGRYSFVFSYCKRFKQKAVQVAFSNKKSEYPAFKLKYFDFSGANSIERVVYALKDGSKWEFYAKGPEQFFEDTGNYLKKRKTERLNKQIILDYLLKLGIDISDENFWVPLTKPMYIEQKYW